VRSRSRQRSASRSLAAAAILGLLSSYQLGLLRRLPDAPVWWADADLIDGSGEAYWIGSMADAPLGVATFALTVVLARRPRRTRLWRAKTAVDAAYSVLLAVEQPVRYGRLCLWCQGVTAFAVSAYVLARRS
jgi:uncharacterized membrane protein